MAIRRYAGDKFVGLSTDSKPTAVANGATFWETDTRKMYCLVSGSWVEAGATPDIVGGRIDLSSATQIEWTFHTSNQISLWNGVGWVVVNVSSGPTLANTANDLGGTALTDGVNYDIFGKRSSDTAFTLHAVNWATDTARYSAWALSTAYSIGDRVSNGSNYYACIQSHTSASGDEPGVGANWADYWLDCGALDDFPGLYRYEGRLVYGPDASGGTSFDGREYRFLARIRLYDDAGTAKFSDEESRRFIMNHYNKLVKTLNVPCPYSADQSEDPGTSFVQAMSGAYKVEFLSDGENEISLSFNNPKTISGEAGSASWQVDATTGNDSDCSIALLGTAHSAISVDYKKIHGEGYHYATPVVRGTAAASTIVYFWSSSAYITRVDVTGRILC